MLEVMLALLIQDDDGKFFRKKEVDFWNRPAKAKAESIWNETAGAPPKEVREFLDSPTRENAERYLAWQRERMQRLRRAMEMLAQVQEAPGLYYFSKPGCPFCVEQDKALSNVKVIRVEADSPLWARYGVRVTPTLVLIRPSKPPRVFEGYTPFAVLEKELGHVDR